MTKFGEISWEEAGNSSEKKNNNYKDVFLRLENGSNELRLITKPFQYLVHKYKPEGDKGFGKNVRCSAINGSCPLCETGDKAKTRWYLGVITRNTNTYKLLDISFSVFSQIKKLAQNTKRWGDPTKYDIDIIVDKNGGATGYYSVQAVGKEPLTAADMKIQDSVDIEDLKRRVAPPTYEQVQKRLEKIHQDLGTAFKLTSTKSEVKSSTPAPVSMEDDEETEFPSYDS